MSIYPSRTLCVAAVKLTSESSTHPRTGRRRFRWSTFLKEEEGRVIVVRQ